MKTVFLGLVAMISLASFASPGETYINCYTGGTSYVEIFNLHDPENPSTYFFLRTVGHGMNRSLYSTITEYTIKGNQLFARLEGDEWGDQRSSVELTINAEESIQKIFAEKISFRAEISFDRDAYFGSKTYSATYCSIRES